MTDINHSQIIQTERLLIRPFELGDAADLFQHLDSDPEVKRYTGGVKTKEDSFNHLKKIIDKQQQTEFIPRAVILRESNELIGWCGLWPFMLDKEQIEIMFGIARKHWQMGYATEAAGVVLKAGFDQYHLNRVVAAVNPDNIASIKVINKLGFMYQKKIDWPGQGVVNYYHLSKLGSVHPLNDN